LVIVTPAPRLLNGSTLLTAAMAHDSTKSDPSLPMVSLVTKLVPDSILLFNDTAVSALHLAAFQGRDRILDHFITTCGVDVNTRAANGHTPLMAAARAGKVGTVILLGGKLSADLYATAATPDGDVTARDIASRFGHAQVVAMLDLLSEKRRWKVAMLCIRSLQAGFVGVERGLAAMGLDLPPPSCEGIVELFLDRRMSLSGGLRGKTIISPFARRMISFL
jgi:Ankyrin repeats (3 copies)